MAKRALSFLIKVALYIIIMFLTEKMVPYGNLVNLITGLFNFQSASAFTCFILGEPDPEVWESVNFYFSFCIATLISIPLMSAVITTYNSITCKTIHSSVLKEWTFSTLRRLVKIFVFIFIFWALFRFLPYQYVFPANRSYSESILAAGMVFNLLLTIFCYWFIQKKIAFKRSL